MLGGVIGSALKGGGALKGLLGKGGKGPLQGLLKGAGGEGPLKGLLQGGAGGGALGKALEAIGGPQGIMDLVQQIIDATKNGEAQGQQGGAPQAGLNPGAAAPAGGAPAGGAPAGAQAAPGAAGQAAPGKGQKLMQRLAKNLAEAKTPQDVDKVIGKLTQKLDANGKGGPQLKQLLQQLGEMRKATLQQGA